MCVYLTYVFQKHQLGRKPPAPKTSEVKVNGEKSLLNRGYSP